MERCYHIISIEKICDTAFVITYKHMDKAKTYLEGRSKSVFILCSQASGNKYFIDYQDEEIIEDFLNNWHKSKKRFNDRKDVLTRWISWMKRKGVVPSGNRQITQANVS